MNAHFSQSLAAESELRNLAAIPYQMISPGNNKPIIGIFQDSLLGSFRFTRPNITMTPREAMNLLMNFPNVDVDALRLAAESNPKHRVRNFDVLSQIMPPVSLKFRNSMFDDKRDDPASSNHVLEIQAGKYVRGQLDKGTLEATSKGILHRICNDFGAMACADFNDALQNIVTEYMKTSSFSVGISDLIANQKTKEEIQKILTVHKQEAQTIIDSIHLGIFKNTTANSNMEEFESRINGILGSASEKSGGASRDNLDPNNRFVLIVTSGSKGSPINIAQMISCLGQQAIDGKRISYGFDHRTLPHYSKFDDSPTARGFIENSYITGLTAPELFFHAMAGRIGLIDTAVKSVTWETPIVIIENGRPLYTEIGRWIDGQMDSPDHRDHIQKYENNPEKKNMELMNLPDQSVFIPTVDSDGRVTWGELTAITRHDPSELLYKITTQSGRTVTVAESESLIVWNEKDKQFTKKNSPDVLVGDLVPVTAVLSAPPTVLHHIDLSDYLPKTKYVYGTEFCKASEMMHDAMKDRKKIPAGWWNEHNGSSFTLPYVKKCSLQRTNVRSNIAHIQEGYVYPYNANRKPTMIPEKFGLNENNGIFIGLFLAEGHATQNTVTITNNDPTIRQFVKNWFDTHSIEYTEREKTNHIGGLTTTIIGYSSILANLLTKLVGSGAEHKHVPSEALVANESFIVGLLNGYYSGDGTVSQNSIDVGSASSRLIEGISMLCSRLGIFGKVSKSQLKTNNLNTKNIKPSFRMSIRSQWGRIFAEKITLLEPKKNDKLTSIKWCKKNKVHPNFPSCNDVVLDAIVQMEVLSSVDHPKLYDVTVPSTLNFCLANGLGVRDTSSTGYIQRRLVKGMEDLQVRYDMTVRNNMGKIIQFAYGDDGFDSTKVENQVLPLVGMTVEDMYLHYDLPDPTKEATDALQVFTKGTITRMRKQHAACQAKCHQYIEGLLQARDDFVTKYFHNRNDNGVRMPVAFQYMIANMHGQLALGPTSAVDITPLETFELLEDYHRRLNHIPCVKTNPLFDIMYKYYLSPRELLVNKRFHRKGLEMLLESILLRFKEAVVHPGEMVGVVCAQSVGEPCTQLTLNSVTYETELAVRRGTTGEILKVQIGDFNEQHIKKSKKVEYMADKDTTYAELDLQDEFYEVPCATEDGQTVWRRIEAVTRHPVINEDGTNTMLRVTTEGCREVIVTKAKSLLQLIDGKIQDLAGADVKIGDYLPCSRRPLEYPPKYVLDMKEILPPTEYVYGSEIAKVKTVMHETRWWKNHAGKTFVVPYKRSDSLMCGLNVHIHGGGAKRPTTKIDYQPGFVYTMNNTISNYLVPDTIELDYDFGYLVGAYAAEGCMTKHQISIANNDSEFFEPILRVCKKWNLTTKVYKNENKNKEGWTSQDIRIYSTLLCRILAHLCGKLSHLKYVSPHIVFSNPECIRGFLDAYISGDGTVCCDKKRNGELHACSIDMSSTSRVMLTDVQVMLRNMGIVSRMYKCHRPTSNNRGTKPENIQQGYSLTVRNKQSQKLAPMLQLTIQSKRDRIELLMQSVFKYEVSTFDDRYIPNVIDGELVLEDRAGRMEDLIFEKVVSIEEIPNTTNYAYDLTVEDTRNFDCYNAVAVSDTFHHSGQSTKSNVTRGVPRIEEILRLTKNPKNPSMTVHLRTAEEHDQDIATKYLVWMEHTRLADVVRSIRICFDPHRETSEVEGDRRLMEQFFEFEKMMEDCGAEGIVPRAERSKWILRLEFDAESLMEHQLTMDDLHYAITNSVYGSDMECVFSDFNSDQLVCRIRTSTSASGTGIFNKRKGGGGRTAAATGVDEADGDPTTVMAKAPPRTLDQSDELYLLKNFQDGLLQNIVLRGVQGVTNVQARKIQNTVVKDDGKFIKRDTWVLDTTGSNLLDTLALDYVDATRTYSNDIKEVFDVLGIEAARQSIHGELLDVMEFSGVSINYHHTSLLADRMTCNKDMVSIFRSGLLSDNVGPIAKATFEMHTEVFLDAARHGEFDPMTGVSAAIMCGQQGGYGTSSFQIIMDTKAMEGVESVERGAKTVSVDAALAQRAATTAGQDECTRQALEIDNHIHTIRAAPAAEVVCVDDEYDAGF